MSVINEEDESWEILETVNVPESLLERQISHKDYHRFIVHYLNRKEKLRGTLYTNIDELKTGVFALYKQFELNEINAFITYLDADQRLVLLTEVPPLLRNKEYQCLFIKSVSPTCSMCASPFGIVDDEVLYECPNTKCCEQYCNSCVRSFLSASDKSQFTCLSCRKNVRPERNSLIEKYLMWPKINALYGTQTLLDLQSNSKSLFYQPLLKDIELRRIHLQSRLATLEKKRGSTISIDLIDENLIKNVGDFQQQLVDLIKEVEALRQRIIAGKASVTSTLKKYQRATENFDVLCDNLMHTIKQNVHKDEPIEMKPSNEHREYIKEKYNMNQLQNLPTQQNIASIDAILEDVRFRRRCLSEHANHLENSLKNDFSSSMSSIDCWEQAQKCLTVVIEVEQTLNQLRENCFELQQLTEQYILISIHPSVPDTPNSRFIVLMEQLRTHTEKLELFSYFPGTSRLMDEWHKDPGIDDNFKPKGINLFQAIEADLKRLLTDKICIYSIPYKIGVVGDTSAGKSALIMNLSKTNQDAAMISNQRSTFGYLQIETSIEDPIEKRPLPISFIDLEGAIDNDKVRGISNYYDIIRKADCDLYILVFDRSFNEFNENCLNYIENVLQRKCLLVRSKVDTLFKSIYREQTGQDYDKDNYDENDFEFTQENVRQQSIITAKDKKLTQKVFLTAAGRDNDLNNTGFGQFDLEQLRKKLLQSALEDYRLERICKLAVRLSTTVINTCFRRGFAVSRTKYRLLAAGASVIPFADEIPAYFGREKIRQAFGIHDSFALTNSVRRTKDSLEEYLTGYRFTVPDRELKSGSFNYLKTSKQRATTPQRKSSIGTKSSSDQERRLTIRPQHQSAQLLRVARVSGYCVIVGGGVVQGIDDIIRVAVPAGAAALRGLSIAGIVVGAVLTPVFAAWAFYSSGKRMNIELHELCDDLQSVFIHFIIHLCNESYDKLLPSEQM